jgi:hypothetical protein
MYEMIVETYEEGKLPDSLTKAVIALIFKKGDTMKLENYRPISLTNYDYKIIAFILATRMQSVISNIVHENQSAYIKNRFIGTNARLVQDIFEFCEKRNEEGLILGLDFEKAFDSLEWSFMLSTLKQFNFGDGFIKWIQILYTNSGIVIKNNGWLSSEIKPSRGIRQGCPVSALLFILAVEILAQNIRDNEKISGICVNDEEIKISQYADDTYMLLSDIESIKETLNMINEFSRIAGPKLNMKKTEGIWLGAYKQFPKNVYGISFTNEPVRCLGIYVGHNKDKCYEKNWIDKMEKMEKILNIWKRRQLSMQGKVTIIKTLIMSKLVYNFSLLSTPEDIISKIDKILFNFIWNKRERIKRNTLIANVERGGISMVDTMSKNMSIKASWVKRLIEGGMWTGVFKWYLNAAGVDLDYMLKMNVKKERECNVYKHLPQFYKEVLLSFNECKTKKPTELLNTYDYLSSNIMGNDLLRSKGKCLYVKSWLESDIKYIKDLYDKNGDFISEDMLLGKLKIKNNWIVEYATIKQAVKKYSNMFDTQMSNYTNIHKISHIVFKNQILDMMELKSKDYYEMLIQKKINRSHMESVWSKEFGILNHIHVWSNIYLRNVKHFPVKKIAEFKYKILNKTLYAGNIISKWNNACSANCKYCGNLETTKHLLYDCKRIELMWKYIGVLLGTNVTWKNIVIGKEELNHNAHFINICVSICAYSIFGIWINCNQSGVKYENIPITNLVKNRLIFYGIVLEKTNLYNKIGKRIVNLF